MEIRAATAFRVTLIVFGVLIALRFLWLAHAIFIVTFLGILLGLAVSRAVDYLEKIKLRRGLIAEPLLAATLVATKMLYVNDVVGDDVKVAAAE
ncbi:MAG TPA: hypothetical protein VM733_21855 [Thermoanaerobaculia bacterium]|nr:hypothetical protein [Thermoanaerobaculia bacterium]